MSLHAIVAALGGDLWDSGRRASVPAPGHSAADRSISLWLVDGRLVIHGFGAVDWREARDHLRSLALIDADNRPTVGTGSSLRSPSDPEATRPDAGGADRR